MLLSIKIEFRLNGELTDIDEMSTIADVLKALNLFDKPVAVELNGAILPRAEHGKKVVRPDDCVEIVHAIGGG